MPSNTSNEQKDIEATLNLLEKNIDRGGYIYTTRDELIRD